MLTPLRADAAVVRSLTLAYNAKVYGNFLKAGNAVLVCPPSGTPQLGWADCLDGANRSDSTAYNDYFDMRYVDVDSDASTFDSSSARVPIPPGATVDYARLFWAGNTGNTTGVASPACSANTPPWGMSRAAYPPRPPAASSPQNQNLRVTVGSGGTSTVAPDVFVSEPAPGYGDAQYYSAQADITGQFVGVSGTTDVTVGNVWTPRGFGCFGGWSLTIVYKFDGPQPIYAPDLRDVFIYEGHVRQGSSDAATNVTISGFRNSGGQPRVGVTAYEGDYGITGDQFRINGTVMAEPSTGATNNYFISNANNELNPSYLNNYSVDAMAQDVPVGVVNTGDTSVRLTFSTSGDSYLAQEVDFSVPIPELRATKEVCRARDATACTSPTGPWASEVSLLPGDTAYWRITVTNPTKADATRVTLLDPDESSCVSAAGTFNVSAGQTRTFYCRSTGLTDTKANTVRASFLPPDDPANPRISPPSTATANIARMTLNKEVSASASGPWTKSTNIRYAGTAYWRITLVNTGGAALTGVSVSDSVAPGCAQTVDLAAGETRYLTCQSANVTDATTNTAGAVFPAPPGSPSGTPQTTVPPSSASVGTYDVQLSKEVCTSTVAANCTSATGPWAKETNGPLGSTAYWRIVVTHRGSVPVTGIAITDAAAAGCAQSTVDLAVRETKTFYCSSPSLTADLTNSATATFTPPGGGTPVAVTDQATYRVYGLTILKEVSTSASGPWSASANGPVGSTAYWRVTVRNVGSGTLNGISIVDPVVPGCVATFNLAAGASKVVTCSTANVTGNLTNSASASFTPPGSATPVTTAPSSASYNVYGLSLVKEVCTGTAAQCSSGGTGTWSASTTVPSGATAYWRITATNVGATTITGITVSDPGEATCQAAATAAGAFTLAASDSRALYCSTANITADTTNTATATYTPPGGGTPVTVNGSATARPFGLTITKLVGKSATGPWSPATTGPLGSTAYWQITVKNIGTVPINGLNIGDTNVPSCVRTGQDVPAGGQLVYTCSSADVQNNIVNTARGTFTVPGRPQSTVDSSAATYGVYGLTLNKEVCNSLTPADCGPGGAGPWVKASSVAKGGNAYWRITATNAGEITLNDITLQDSTSNCQTGPATMPPFSLTAGDSRSFYCSTSGITANTVNVVNGTYTPAGESPVPAKPAQAAVTVYELTLVKEVCSSTVAADCAPGGSGVWLPSATGALGSTAYWRVTATNTGTTPLTGISLSDPGEASCAQATQNAFALTAGESKQFYCATPGVTTNVTNSASATYTRPIGGGTVSVPPTQATYSVYGLTIVKEVCGSPDPQDCAAGGIGPWVRKSSGPVGSTAYWRIVVNNVGALELTGVTLTDANAGGCDVASFSLAAGATRTVFCQSDNVTANMDNTATVRYTPPGQTSPITTPATAEYDVHGIRLVKEVSESPDGPWTKDIYQSPPPGGATAYWRITLSNVGGVDLAGISVLDLLEATCRQTVDLKAGETKYVTCSTSGLTTNTTNIARAQYNPPDGGAPVTTPPDAATLQTFGLLLVKEVCDSGDSSQCTADGPGPWRQVVNGPIGDTAYWRIRVANSGGVALTGITLTDPSESSCAAQFPAPIDLAVKEERKFGCSTPDIRTDTKNTVTASYTGPDGDPVNLSTDATFRPYGLTVVKEVCASRNAADCASGGVGPWQRSVQLPLGATAYWRVTATNTGTSDLSAVVINDRQVPGCAKTVNLPVSAPTQQVYCSTPSLANNQTNTVTGTYTPVGEPENTTPPSTATALVYGVSVVKEVCLSDALANCAAGGAGPWGPLAQLPVGSTARWRITITNTGGVPLTGVTLADGDEPSCVVSAGFDLAVGESKAMRCETAGLTTDKTNKATATVPPPSGAPVGTPPSVVPSGEAKARVYGLTLTKQVATSASGPWQAAASGPLNSTAYWRLVLTNTGTIDLSGVSIEDQGEHLCDRSGLSVPAGSSVTVDCSSAGLTTNRTNTATGSYTKPGGGSAMLPPAVASYSVYGMRLVKEACLSTVASECIAGGTASWGPVTTVPVGGTAYWRIRATNVGAVPLVNVTLQDPSESDCQAEIDLAGPFTLAEGDTRAMYCETTPVTTTKVNTVTGKYTPQGLTPIDADPASATAQTFGLTLVKEVGQTASGPWSAKTAGEVGSTAYWRITATNTGTVPVKVVTVQDDDEPSCNVAPFELAPGASREVMCSTASVAANKSNSADATYTPDGGTPQKTPPTTAEFDVYGMSLVKEVCTGGSAQACAPDGPGPWAAETTVARGTAAYWRITARNTGNTVLTAITLRDTGEPACQSALDKSGPFTLTEGDSAAFYCNTDSVTADLTNTVEGTFTTPGVPPKPVAPSSAKVRVHGLTLLKEVSQTPDGPWSNEAYGAYGSTAYWRITVTNLGTVALSDVAIADPAEPSCVQTVTLAPGESKVLTCRTAGVKAKKTNTATATYTPPGGKPVTTDPSTADYEVGAAPKPTPTPTKDPIPVTGAPIGNMVPLGSGLIVLGALLLLFARRITRQP